MNKKSNASFILILFILACLGGSAALLIAPAKSTPNPPFPSPTIPVNSPNTTQNSLQLQTFTNAPSQPIVVNTLPPSLAPSITPTPKPVVTYCTHDSLKSSTCTCPASEGVICENKANGKCASNAIDCSQYQTVNPPAYAAWGCDVNSCIYLKSSNASVPACSPQICYGKPVIYLYPAKTSLVNVKLDIPGYVTQSIPAYPSDTGWENVEAHPDGTLVYQQKIYHELYYESAVSGHINPQSGTVIPMTQLPKKLDIYLDQLGLLPDEKQEFFAYWLPKLSALHSQYILFSVLTPEQKEETDHVIIIPRPDTAIEFLVYFKPVSTSFISIPPLFIAKPLERKGFTVVEWGGTIDL